MKKMSFTNSKWSSLFGRSAFLVLFALCMAGLQSANAQIVMKYTKNDTTCTTHKLTACNGDPTATSTRFTDDGTNDGNYADPTGHLRRDTTEFCPTDAWHRVKVVFTDFDLEANDSLVIYQGDKKATRGTANNGTGPGLLGAGIQATGTGVSQANGGWVDANCDPNSNASGCLTFIFYTNGGNSKGKGFDAWVDCEARKVTFGDVNITPVKLTCAESFRAIPITAPTLKFCDVNATGQLIYRVKNQHGVTCFEGMVAQGGVLPTRNYAIGQYAAEFKYLADSTKTKSATFSVQAPALVCNDQVNVPLGSACMVVLTPDDILENPCDTTDVDSMYYNITVTLGSGPKAVVKKTTGHDTKAAVVYPIITADDIKKAGLSVCGGTGTVKIERIYFGDRDGDGNPDLPAAVQGLMGCNNGTKKIDCSTSLQFSDQSIPWISISADADTVVACDSTGLLNFITVGAIDNCDDKIKPELVSVRFAESDPCFNNDGRPDTTQVTISYRAVDACGNVGSSSKTLWVLRPDLQRADRLFAALPTDKSVDCDASTAATGTPGVKIGLWKNSTIEVKDTVELSTEEYRCGYILVKRDIDIPATDCGKKTYRYWSVLDWCTPDAGPTALDTTFIEYTDKTAPLFLDSLPERVAVSNHPHLFKKAPKDIVIELGHFECTYDINKLAKPKAVDNCDANPKVRIDSVFRIEDGGKWGVPASSLTKLDCDSFCIRYVVEDECHEQLKNDTVLQIVEIKDLTKPSAVVIDQLNLSLPNEWGARVCVKDIDAGSYDACGIATREIRIKGSGAAWTECIDIGCKYVHPDLQIEMRVTDKKGNTNIAWLDVLVEDKIKPYCESPGDKQENCDKFHNGELGASTDADGDRKMEDSEWAAVTADLQATYNKYFGAFKCEDNLKVEECGQLTEEEQYQLIEWPCGEIELKRRHRATDWSNNTSAWVEQNVKIVYKAGWKFTVPDDWTGDCGDQAIAPSLVIDNGACDLLGYEVTSKLFEVPGDACWKMERTYHIINWCKYTAGQAPVELARVEGEHGFAKGFMITSEGNEDKGYFTYVQILKVHDDEAPVVTVVDPDPCITGIEFDALPYGEEDQTPGTAPYECDEPKTWTASATDCSDQSAITWVGRLFDANGNVVATSATNSITFVVTNKSTYTAEFWAYDGCGNSGGKKGETLKFWDCKKPTPYLLNGVAVELMQTGMIQVWATDLNQGSFDNCTDQSKLDLRIWHANLGDAPTTLEGVRGLPKVIDLGCNELGTQNVHIYAIDEEGNWDYAQTYVIVQDNMGACTNVEPNVDGMVAGKIVDGNGENVQSVSIAVNGADQKSMVTSADGHYMFMLPKGGDYTVTPEKDMNPLNGVSTFDLVLISKHILGITTFDTPYKYIAADVNKSGSITAFDMVQLRQLILNITSEFPNNDSWRFVEGGYEFTSTNPAAESFNEFVSINNLNANMESMDFTAVKVGDVNGSALANNLLGAETRNAAGDLNLTVADRFVEAGQTVTVSFTSEDIANAAGYQFTLNVAGTANVVEGVAKAANFNTNLSERGLIATSWNGEATSTDVLFAITYTANQTGLLSELVSISSDVTTAEAYSTEGELLNVGINFTEATTAGFELNQNTPNPFAGTTQIGFNLPAAGSATLTVLDVQGKVLKSVTADYAKGYNQVSLNANELGATGVLYYQLESADNVATKKMIIIE